MNKILHTIKACIYGDQKAQRSLYEMHRARWYMTSMRYGKGKMQADDIMQEGLIAIYNSLKQYDHHKSAFATWSNRVIANAALRYLKKNSWANMMSDIDEAYDLSDDGEQIYDHLGAQELTKLIQQLPIGYRIVFNMYAIEGYSHKEIATELDIKEGTSKSQLYKARNMLKVYLENQLINGGHV